MAMSEASQKASQYIVQAFLANPCMTQSQLSDVIKSAFTTFTQGTMLVERDGPGMMRSVVQLFQKYGMDIRMSTDQRGTRRYALINTIDDPIAKLATSMSPASIEYFRTLVCNICRAGGSVKLMDAYAARPSSLTQADVDDLFEAWIREMWLEKTAGDKVTLGVRGALDMRPFLETLMHNETAAEEEADAEEAAEDAAPRVKEPSAQSRFIQQVLSNSQGATFSAAASSSSSA
jgi:hypothetical protein